jgi:hypothetical protein
MLELRTLGTLELTSDAGLPLAPVLSQPRRTALLCYLALGSPRGFRSRDTLYAVFWPEHGAEQARHALRQALYFLRRHLGAAAVVSRGDGSLGVAPDRVRCDAAEFEARLDAGEPEGALALYRGDLLPGFTSATRRSTSTGWTPSAPGSDGERGGGLDPGCRARADGRPRCGGGVGASRRGILSDRRDGVAAASSACWRGRATARRHSSLRSVRLDARA